VIRKYPPLTKIKTTLFLRRQIVARSMALTISTGAGNVVTIFGTVCIGPSSPEEYPSCPRFKPHVYRSSLEKQTE
jgi:hypothetical protein